MSQQLEEYLNTIESEQGETRHKLLQFLIGIQQIEGHIPPEAISRLADRTLVPVAQIRGLISFYTFLYDKPHGDFRILFSDNITDRMAGSGRLLDRLCKALEFRPIAFNPVSQPICP